MSSEAKIVITAADKTAAAFQSVKTGLQDMQGRVSGLTGALGALGATAALASFVGSIKSAVDAADQINKLSQRTGVAAEQLSQLQFAAKLSDVSVDALTTGLKKLNVSIADGLAGDKEKIQAFRNLGISLKDAAGQVKTADQVLLEMANSFSTAKDGAIKTAYAVFLMGKAGDEMIPLLNGGSGAITEMMQKAQRLGLTISKDFARQAEEFNDNLTIMGASSQKLSIALAQDLVSGLGKAAKAMADATVEGGKLQGLLAGIQTLFTGDAQHKNNVALVEDTERLMNLQNGLDRLRAAGYTADTAAWRSQIKQIDEVNARLRTTMTVRKELAGQAEKAAAAEPKKEKDLPPLPKVGSVAAAKASEYDALIKRIKDRIALQKEELSSGRELTDAEKFQAKAEQDLASIKKGVNAERKAAADALLEEAKNGALLVHIQRSELESLKAAAVLRQQLRNTDYEQSSAALRDIEAARQQSLKAITDRVKEQRAENEANELAVKLNISLAEAIEMVTIARMEEERGQKAIPGGEEDEALRKEIEARRELLGLLHSKADFDKAREMWESIDRTAHDTFVNIFDGGSNIFQRLGQTLKAAVLDRLYQMTVRPWVVNLVGSMTGSPAGAAMQMLGSGSAGGSPLGSFGSLGNLGSLFGGGSGGGLGGMFPGLSNGLATASNAMGFGAGANAFGMGGVSAGMSGAAEAVAMEATLTAGGTGAGALAGMGPLMSAMPYLAIAAIAISLLSKKRGGPKADGTFGLLNSGIGLGDHSGETDGAARTAAQGLQTQYDAIVKSFGGQGGLQFGMGFSTDPKGTSPSFVDFTASRAGKVAFSDFNGSVGRSEGELQATIGEMGARAMLRGLQQSNLEGQIGQYLAQLGDVSTLAADQITAAVARVTKAGTEKATLEEQIYQLAHTDIEKLARSRQQELDAVDATNRALLERRISLEDEYRAATKAKTAIDRARASASDSMQFVSGIRSNIGGYLDKLNGTPAGLLSPEAQLANSRAQFDRQLALARGGDRDALGGITGYADQLISAQTAFSASGGATSSTIAGIKQALAELPAMRSDAEVISDAIRQAGEKTVFTLKELQGSLVVGFDEVDTSLDDALDFGELRAYLGGIASDETLRQIISAVDADKSGSISRLELLTATVNATSAREVAAIAATVGEAASVASVTSAAAAAAPEVNWGGTGFADENAYRAHLDASISGAYADGGDPPVGKLVMVGERGPELARFTSPARIYSSEQSSRMLRDPEVLAELRALRQQNAELIRQLIVVSATGAREVAGVVGEVADNTASSARAARLLDARAAA